MVLMSEIMTSIYWTWISQENVIIKFRDIKNLFQGKSAVEKDKVVKRLYYYVNSILLDTDWRNNLLIIEKLIYLTN